MATKDYYSKEELKGFPKVIIPLLSRRIGFGGNQVLSGKLGFRGVLGDVHFHFPVGSGDPIAGYQVGATIRFIEGAGESGELVDTRRGNTSLPAIYLPGYIYGDDGVLSVWSGRECNGECQFQLDVNSHTIAAPNSVSLLALLDVYILPDGK